MRAHRAAVSIAQLIGAITPLRHSTEVCLTSQKQQHVFFETKLQITTFLSNHSSDPQRRLRQPFWRGLARSKIQFVTVNQSPANQTAAAL